MGRRRDELPDSSRFDPCRLISYGATVGRGVEHLFTEVSIAWVSSIWTPHPEPFPVGDGMCWPSSPSCLPMLGSTRSERLESRRGVNGWLLQMKSWRILETRRRPVVPSNFKFSEVQPESLGCRGDGISFKFCV